MRYIRIIISPTTHFKGPLSQTKLYIGEIDGLHCNLSCEHCMCWLARIRFKSQKRKIKKKVKARSRHASGANPGFFFGGGGGGGGQR